MTTAVARVVDPPAGSPSKPAAPLSRTLVRFWVPAATVLAVLARLPFMSRSPAPDEAGYLIVGRQWQPGGTSLYGHLWVDRPPLLIALFRFAADLGGLVPLRLLGCLATAVVVLGCAHVARALAGPRAAGWSAAVAAAWTVCPLLGGLEVNGELLAAPFVVVGISAVLWGRRSQSPVRVVSAWAVAGASTVAAVLVKQNMVDVAVFAVAVMVVDRWQNGVTSGRQWSSVVGYGAGGTAVLAAASLWTLWHGTSLTGVFDAMYPFRLEAARVLATSSHRHATARMWALCISWLVSGGAVIMGMALWALASRRLAGSPVWGLTATTVFGVVSVASGGNFWHHYLIELVVPAAITAGLLRARGGRATTTVLVTTVLVGTVAWAGALLGSAPSDAAAIGRAVARSARPGDTIISAFGHADIVAASGLDSPYPYLWSLPARTLDPNLTTLNQALLGPHATTWFVTSSSLAYFDSRNPATARLLTSHYHRVAELHSTSVYLRDGVLRGGPRPPGALIASAISGRTAAQRTRVRP